MPISARVFWSLTIVSVIFALTAAAAVAAAFVMQSRFAGQRALIESSAVIADAQDAILLARFRVEESVRDPKVANRQQVLDGLLSAVEEFSEARTRLERLEAANSLETALEKARRFGAQANRTLDMHDRVARIERRMAEIEVDASRRFETLVEAARDGGAAEPIYRISEARYRFARARDLSRRFLESGDTNIPQRFNSEMAIAIASTKAFIAAEPGGALNAAADDILERMERFRTEFSTALLGVNRRTATMTNGLLPAGDALVDDLTAATGAILSQVAQDAQEAETVSTWTSFGLVGLLTASVLLAVAAGSVLTASIVRPINRITGVMRQMARGELDVEIPKYGQRGELGAMASALVVFQKRLLRKEERHQRIDGILDNIFPKPLADRLRAGEKNVAEGRAEAVVVLIDLVGFTELTKRIGPSHLVETLDDIFGKLDEAADRIGVEKVKTIGDAYMAAAGLTERPDRTDAWRAATFALEAQVIIDEVGRRLGYPLKIRTGIHLGPAVAGVLGKQKAIYDVWGEAVNIASRIETSANPGEIRASEQVFYRLRNTFDFELIGEVDLKGVGPTTIYRLKTPVRVEPSGTGEAAAPGDERASADVVRLEDHAKRSPNAASG